MSDIHRRSFIRGLTGLFGVATIPDLEKMILDAGCPILLQPTHVSNTIYVPETGHLFLGDQTIHSFPVVTWKQYFVDLGAKTKMDLVRLTAAWEVDEIDELIDNDQWPGIYEMHYDPMPAAYHLLRRLKIGTGIRSRAKTAGRLDFFAGSNHPGSNDLWVEAYDDLSVSLLQANLIELGQPIRIEMEAGSIVKYDGFDFDSQPADD
jgi:hypothetical protein